MFIELNNGKLISMFYLQYVEVDRINLIYFMTNGQQVIEELSSEAEALNKKIEVEEKMLAPLSGGGGGGGTTIHNQLTGRTAANAHPISAITDLQNTLDTKIEDAPNDGKQYIRQEEDWKELTVTGEVEEAPDDGKVYGRQNKDWSEISASSGVIIVENHSSANPFVLEGKEPGIYVFKDQNGYNSSVYLCGKNALLPNWSRYSITGGTLILLEKVTATTPDNTEVAISTNDRGELTKIYVTSVGAGVGSTSYSNQLVTTVTDQNVNGKKIFGVLPESSVVPTLDDQLINKKYADDLKLKWKEIVGSDIELTDDISLVRCTKSQLEAIPKKNGQLIVITGWDYPGDGHPCKGRHYIDVNNQRIPLYNRDNIIPNIIDININSHGEVIIKFDKEAPSGSILQFVRYSKQRKNNHKCWKFRRISPTNSQNTFPVIDVSGRDEVILEPGMLEELYRPSQTRGEQVRSWEDWAATQSGTRHNPPLSVRKQSYVMYKFAVVRKRIKNVTNGATATDTRWIKGKISDQIIKMKKYTQTDKDRVEERLKIEIL